MTDKELADRVVALGPGGRLGGPDNCKYCVLGMDLHLRADRFVRDWRVAGKLIEMCYEQGFEVGTDCEYLCIDVCGGTKIQALSVEISTSICRSFIEACCEALDD